MGRPRFKIYKKSDDDHDGVGSSGEDSPVEKNAKKKKSFSLLRILSWIILFAIGYVIGLYISIPIEISYGLILLFGILAIVIDLDESKMRWFKQVPLLRHHFSIMHRINRKIGDSAQAGNLKGAFQFLWGMITLTFYLFWMNVLLNLIKYALSFSLSEIDPLRFIESFIALLGAGVMAYIVWLKAFYHDFAHIKNLASSKKIKEKMKSIGKFATFLVKLYTLGWTYSIWMGGEILFLYISDEMALLGIFAIFAAIFFVAIIIILIGIVFLTKSAADKVSIEEAKLDTLDSE
jgi:hypothetical protein